jgi:hypothetical protein
VSADASPLEPLYFVDVIKERLSARAERFTERHEQAVDPGLDSQFRSARRRSLFLSSKA